MNRQTALLFARLTSAILSDRTKGQSFQRRHALKILRSAYYHQINCPVTLLRTSAVRKYVKASKLRIQRAYMNQLLALVKEAA